LFRIDVVSALLLLLGWSVLTRALPLFVLALVLLLAVGVSRLWEKYALTGIEYKRNIPSHRAGFGEKVVLEVEIVNRKLLPVSWMEFEDGIPSALAPAIGRVSPSPVPGRSILSGLVSLRPYERIRRHYPIHCTVRGEHRFGPVMLRSGDLFGFVDCEKILPTEDTLVVYPRVVLLTRLGLPARSPLGELRVQSWLFEDVSRIAGAREYRPGDGLRRIHWPASARTQCLQTRVYEATTCHRLGIFLNVATDENGEHEDSYDPDVLELAITTAASIASWGLEQGYQTGIYTNGQHLHDRGCVVVEPASESAQLERVLLALARLQPLAIQQFDELLAEQFRQLHFGTTVVVVTATLLPDTSAQLLDLRSRGHAATVVLTGRSQRSVTLRGIAIRQVGPPESWREMPTLALSGGNGLDR
jgi:uncharacterized protein (DUF58 family)